MRTVSLLALVLLTACGASEDPYQAALMDQIEHKVKMPKEAEALDRYSRFYTQAKSGEIIATFVGSTHNDLQIGHRRWVADVYHLPAIDDGECFVVNVIFDPKTKK